MSEPDDREKRLSPEIEAALEQVVEKLQRRRKRSLAGYLLSLVVIIVGTLLGLAYMGGAAPGEFRGWILLVPIAVVGVVLWAFGRWSRSA